MAKPLLYQPMPKWQFIAAFGGALTLHMIAVGIAALKPEEPPPAEITNLEQIAEVSFEPEAAPPEPTPPPEEEPEPVEAPPEPIDPPEFVEEEKPTPPPKPRSDKPKPIAPIARPTGPAGPPGAAPSGRAAMIFKPNLQYPYEAKRARMTGSGIIVCSVNPSGGVTGCNMGKSTGHAVLDNAATSAFRSARFKPGTVPQVRIPITFTLTGAQF